MMPLIKYEFIKMRGRKSFIVILILLLLSQFFLFSVSLNQKIPLSAYQKFHQTLLSLPNEKRYEFTKKEYEKYQSFMILEQLTQLRQNEQKNASIIEELLQENPNVENYQQEYISNHQPQYTSSLEQDAQFLEMMFDEMTQLKTYFQYIKDIQQQAQQLSGISIFQSHQNQNEIERSAKDFQKLTHVEITYDIQYPLEQVFSFDFTILFLVIIVLSLSYCLIMEERETGLMNLLKFSQNGYMKVIIAKFIVMFLITSIICFLVYVGKLGYMAWNCGLGDLSRSIQSLAHYRQCPLQMNVKQWVGLMIGFKILALSLLGIMMMSLCLVVKNRLFSWISILVFFVVEVFCYLMIHPLSSLYLWKYINMISFLQTDTYLKIYRYISVFGLSTTLYHLHIFVITVGLILGSISCICIYVCKRDFSLRNAHFVFQHCFHLSSLCSFEFYKMIKIQKVGILIILSLFLQYYQYHHVSVYMDSESSIYQSYMQYLQGPLTDEKIKWIEQQQDYFDSLHQQIEKIENNINLTSQKKQSLKENISMKLIGENVFNDVKEQYEWIQKHPQAEFVYERPYEEYFLSSSWSLAPSLMLMIFLSLSLYQVINIEYENHVNEVSQITINGNHRILELKIIGCVIIIGIGMSIFYGTPLIFLHSVYGFSSLGASVISIPTFRSLPSVLTLGHLFLIDGLIKFIICMSLTSFLLMISVKARHTMTTLFISLCLFVIPLFLIYNQIDCFKDISFYPMLNCIQYCIENPILLIVQIMISIIVMILSLKKVFQQYFHVL